MTWFACEQPERAPDPSVQFHYHDCGVCRFKADVQRHRFPDDAVVQRVFNNLFGFEVLS